MMYSYVTEFNLAVRGDEADEYLLDAVRTWPTLWGSIPGVTGTLLLANAFALGGDFEYQWRVDIDKLATLARIDETVKAGEGGWRESRKKWFRARTALRAHVSRHVAGDERYCEEGKGTHGAVHAVVSTASLASRHSSEHPEAARERLAPARERLEALRERVEAVRSVSGIHSAQARRAMLGSAVSGEQIWLRMDSLERLDDLAGVHLDAAEAQVFGEIREVDGALFEGA
jgi:hypothetical protein